MPTVRELEQSLFAYAPKELAMSWDNVGHLIGNPSQEVERVLVALDVTEDVADEAISGKFDLIVSHHPIMNCKWLPVQSIRNDTPQGHLLLKLLFANISVICMHTNLDAAQGGVNDAFAEALKLVDPGPMGEDGFCRVGTLPEPMVLRDFAAMVSDALHCNGLRYADAGKPVYKVGIGGGACSDFEAAAIACGCDTFVTSDLTYHTFLDAKGKGINLIDAGHFPREDPVCAKLVSYLSGQFSTLSVIKSTSHKEVIQYYVKGE